MSSVPVVSVLKSWKEFEFAELQQTLDNEATSIALRQDQSEISRKALVELSKEFKRNSSEETRKSVSTLLKSFQKEIDTLSKRAKASETAMLSVYKKLIDIPDPVPSLEQSIVWQKKVAKQADAELEVEQLRQTLDEYNKEFVDVKNQEVTIKQLRDKIKSLEDDSDTMLAEKSREKERDLRSELAEKESRLEEDKCRLESKVATAEEEVFALRTALAVAQSQVMEMKSATDRLSVAKGSEYELVMVESERAAERAAVAEGRVAALQARVDELEKSVAEGEDNESNDDSESSQLTELRVELGAKRQEVDQLVEDVRRLQAALSKAKEARVGEASDLAEKLRVLEAESENMRRQLAAKADYDEMKKELDILKSMECGPETSTDTDTDQTEPKQQQSLEYLLLARNRSLMNENTQTKLALTNEKERAFHLDRDNEELKNQVADLKTLVARLEDHLLVVKKVGSSSGSCVAMDTLPVRSEAEGSASPPLPVSSASSQSLSASVGDGDVAVEIGESTTDEFLLLQKTTSLPATNASNDDSLLAIVSSQRERFRQRNQDLEAENISYKNRVQSLQDDLDLLRNDNLKLFEKIKFLQTNYSSSSSSSAAVAGSSPAGLESRYASQYEQSLDPFQTFARKERNRKYGSMRPYEKATLAMVRFILGSPLARTFAFFYSVFLHLLVFLVLYRFSTLQDCHQDAREDCAKQFADHMLHVHGGND